MRLTIPEPKITIGTHTFADFDKLGRAPLAHRLTELVDRIDDPITIALDGGWGSGKSFFLKLWVGEHKLQNGKAHLIYFDAFEHDFLDDPLVGLVGAIAEDEETTTQSGSSINSLKKWAWKLAKPVARAGLFAITSGVSEVVGAVGDAAIKVASEEAEQTLEQFWAKEDGKRAAMKGFRAALSALTDPANNGIPRQKIVLIIDELDRCRPDYALSMLETIKHFFAVPRVHFVLGVNMKALADSVKARYGSGIDAERYLQKFIQIRIPFKPRPGIGGSCGDVSKYWKIVSEWIGTRPDNYVNGISCYLEFLQKTNPPSLRDLQRLGTLESIIPVKPGMGMLDWHLTCGLLFLQVMKPELVDRGRSGDLTFDEIKTFFWQNAPPNPHDKVQNVLSDAWQYALDPTFVISEERDQALTAQCVAVSSPSMRIPVLIETYLDRFQLLS